MKGKRGRNKESIGWLDEFALRRQLACVLFRCVLRDMERYDWQIRKTTNLAVTVAIILNITN